MTSNPTLSSESNEKSFDHDASPRQDQTMSDQNFAPQEVNQNSDREGDDTSRDANDTRSRHPFKRRRHRHPHHSQNRFPTTSEGQENNKNDQDSSGESQNMAVQSFEVPHHSDTSVKKIEKSDSDLASSPLSKPAQNFDPLYDQSSENQATQEPQKKKRGNTWWKRLIDN